MRAEDLSLVGLDSILDVFADRFEIDVNGRLVASRIEGNLPRFVLGRTAIGCVWRFSAEVDEGTLRSVAKLAGREPGFPIAENPPAPRPERLVMIERLLAGEGPEISARREVLVRGDEAFAELWTID